MNMVNYDLLKKMDEENERVKQKMKDEEERRNEEALKMRTKMDKEKEELR